MFYKETEYFSEPIYRLCLILSFKIYKRAIELQMDITNNIKPFIMKSCWVLDHRIELAKLLINMGTNYASFTVLIQKQNKKFNSGVDHVLWGTDICKKNVLYVLYNIQLFISTTGN